MQMLLNMNLKGFDTVLNWKPHRKPNEEVLSVSIGNMVYDISTRPDSQHITYAHLGDEVTGEVIRS